MTILCFVLYRVASRYGLPVTPEWASWFYYCAKLKSTKGDYAVTRARMARQFLVRGQQANVFSDGLVRALRERLIRIPARERINLMEVAKDFLGEEANLQPTSEERPQETRA